MIKNILSHNNFAGFVDVTNVVNNQKYYSDIISKYNDLQKDIFHKENNNILKLVSNNCYVFLDKKEQINSSKEFNKSNFFNKIIENQSIKYF